MTDKRAHKAWQKHHDDAIMAQCILLAGMTPELRRQNKAYDASTIMAKLRDMHERNMHSERYHVSRKLLRSRMTEGTSVEKHVFKMVVLIDKLADQELVLKAKLSVDLIL